MQTRHPAHLPDTDIRLLLKQLTGADPSLITRLASGQEVTAAHCTLPSENVVVLLSPDWRTPEELRWVHNVSLHAARTVVEAVAPIAFDGRTLFQFANNRIASIYPFVCGDPLDTTSPAQRNDAARVLAQVHRALLSWTGGPRPPHGAHIPLYKRIDRRGLELLDAYGHEDLHDEQLDQWWLSRQATPYAMCPTQGDFWSANILCRDDRVVGLIDWHDARVIPCISEAVWAAWSCTGGERIGPEFYDFLETYRQHGGPLRPTDLADAVPLLRLRIRGLIRRTIAMGCPPDHPYVTDLVDAFNTLSG